MTSESMIDSLVTSDYEYGFSTDLETDVAPLGLSEDTVRLISAKKNEPQWLLDWRLKAFSLWQGMEEPDWAKLQIAPIDYQSISYWAAPKQKPKLDSLDDVDPEIREMFDKLGIPLNEQKILSNVAVDAIVDSVSVTTTFKRTLLEAGVVFCSFSEAVRDYPELVREHLGSVVPLRDNFFAALNSAVFSDGSFCYIPKGVRCPMELSTYFRINSMNTGQFERTLIVAEEDSHVSYLEGCVTEDANITLPDGTQTMMRNLKVGDHVRSHTGRPTEIVAKFSRPYIGDLIQVLPTGQSVPVVTTCEHPYWAVKQHGDETEWIRAEQLEIGDWIVYPKSTVLAETIGSTIVEHGADKGDAYWLEIQEINREFYEGEVWNVETEENSYCVERFATHNCTAPQRDENQLHAAVVELVAKDRAEIKYSTVQNWYPGDENGVGGIYNFVTKRGRAHTDAKISWTQVETGSAITWKYPSVVLQGDRAVGEFYSVALTNKHQQADTGTKMVHIGKDTTSSIISKGISAGKGQNTYRGLVKVLRGADGARNYTQCDSLLIGKECGAHTIPYIEVKNPSAQVEHEASTSTVEEDQLYYCCQRGMSEEDAMSMIVNGFCREVFAELPMEFAVEAQRLLSVSLEGSVG